MFIYPWWRQSIQNCWDLNIVLLPERGEGRDRSRTPAVNMGTFHPAFSVLKLFFMLSSNLSVRKSSSIDKLTTTTIIPSYPWGTCPQIPSGCPKPQAVQNPRYTILFPSIQTYYEA